jgi:apolipoprotein N-acyltransferase
MYATPAAQRRNCAAKHAVNTNFLLVAAQWHRTGTRKRRFTAAFLAGAGASLALAPFHFIPVLFVSFTMLTWLLDGVRPATGWRGLRAAAAIGWWFGFGFFLSGLYWVGFALTVDAESFGQFIPVAVLALPAGLALFCAMATSLASLGWSAGPARILVLALGWSLAEWLRGHIFTGFPWNLIGYAWSADFAPLLAVMQSVSLIGIYGLGLITIVLAALPALLADGGLRTPPVCFALGGGALLLLCMMAFGFVRLGQTMPGDVAGVRLRIIQPNIAQAAKWQPEQRATIFRTLIDLSMTPSALAPTHVIWPEAATPFFLLQSEQALAQMARLVPATGAVITGAPRLGAPESVSEAPVYNSVVAVGGDGNISAIYDKAHLVPFGEYLPFPGVFAAVGLKKLTVDLGSFASGPGPKTLTAPGIPPFSPLICYEVIFPGAVVDASTRPGWLLNVTNDAWFGDTSGPQQHLAQARARAVEQGLPLIRAANTGISGVFDAYGRSKAQLALNHQGIIDSGLPSALPPTLYARWGDYIYAGLLLLIQVLFLALRKKIH